MNDAIGLIETKGLLPLIEATDAMAKAANVEIVKRIDIGGGLCHDGRQWRRRQRPRCRRSGCQRSFASRRTGQQPHHPSSVGRFGQGFFGLTAWQQSRGFAVRLSVLTHHARCQQFEQFLDRNPRANPCSQSRIDQLQVSVVRHDRRAMSWRGSVERIGDDREPVRGRDR